MITKEQISSLLEIKFQNSEFFVVGVTVKPGNKISIQVEKDSGITIKECVEIHRFIGKSFDRDTEDFSLDVSSPGADKPIKNFRQYPKNIGRKFGVKTKDGEFKEGILVKAENNEITLQLIKEKKNKNQDTETITINSNNIEESKIILAI